MKKSQVAILTLLIIIMLISIGCSYYEAPSKDISLPTSELVLESDSDKLVLKIAYTLPPEHHLSKFFTLVYTEAFSRMNIDFQIEIQPPERASEYANKGLIAGEINRAFSYNDTYTNLVRVEEPHMYVHFSAFSTDPTVNLNGWESLENTDYRVEYRLGVQKTELILPKYISKDKLSKSYSIEDSIQHLIDDKIDLYVDVENSVEGYLNSESFGDGVKVFNSGVMEATTGHVFLHKRYKNIALELSEVLKDMKSEGLFDKYIEDLGLSQYDILIK